MGVFELVGDAEEGGIEESLGLGGEGGRTVLDAMVGYLWMRFV